MNDAAFAAKLEDARRKIDALPAHQQEPLRRLLEETRRRHVELKTHFGRVHEALADWRVGVKYLLFDIEATKREVSSLRRRLEDRTNPGTDDEGGR